MIILNQLSKSFTTKNGTVEALKSVSLKIDKGDIFGIIGQSGAGKSTLLRTINHLEAPDSGYVAIDGILVGMLDEKALTTLRQKIGMIFQGFNLFKSRTVKGNIAFPLELAGWEKEAIEARVDELLSIVDMSDKKDAYPAQLSGGQKQRVAIARAIAAKPDLLLCDEATSALDPETTISILQLLKSINQQLGITIVLITHELEVVRQICKHGAIMKNGVIVKHGRATDLLAHQLHQSTTLAHSS